MSQPKSSTLENLREICTQGRAAEQEIIIQLVAVPYTVNNLEKGEIKELVDIIWHLWQPAASTTFSHKVRNALQACLSVGKAPVARQILMLVKISPSNLSSKKHLQALTVLFAAGNVKECLATLINEEFPHFLLQLLSLSARDDLASLAGKLMQQYVRLAPSSLDDEFIKALSQSLLDSKSSRNCLIYTVQPLLKIQPSLYDSLSQSLSQSSTGGQERQAAEIALAEIAYSQGCIARRDISESLLENCINHPKTSIRISALEIVCKCLASPASRLTFGDFARLYEYFTYNLGIADSECRSKTLGAVYALLERLRSSTYAAARDLQKKKGDVDDLSDYLSQAKSFLTLLSTACLRNLNPVAPFRTVITSLSTIELLLQSGLDSRFRIAPAVLKRRLLAWPGEVRLDVVNEKTVFHLLRCLKSNYTDIRNLANAILAAFPCPISGYEKAETIEADLISPAMHFVQNVRGSEAASAALIFNLVCTQTTTPSETIIDRLFIQLDANLEIADSDLTLAAEKAPLHGVLASLRSLLPLNLEREILEKLRKKIQRIFKVTSPVLASAAPEGSVADHEEARAMLFDIDSDDEGDDQDNGRGPRPKVLLSYCWRAMKEAGALLTATVSEPARQKVLHKLVSHEEIEQTNDHFTTFLLQIRHRGAFSHIAESYTNFCTVISQDPQSVGLVQNWLQNRLSDLIDTSDRYSITRRSGGLPFCLLAIATGLRTVSPACTEEMMNRLIAVAVSNNTESAIRVHTLNAIRVFFLDTHFSSILQPCIGPAFLCAIAVFRSEIWDERNGALLVFSALMQRTFGGRQSSINVSNDQTRPNYADFFQRHAGLEQQLAVDLESCASAIALDHNNAAKQASLFAMLILLSQLQNAPQTQLAQAIATSVSKCLSSRIFKIRDAAAAVLANLTAAASAATLCQSLLTESQSAECCENRRHGLLLTCGYMADFYELDLQNSAAIKDAAENLSSRHRSLPVRTAYIRLLRELPPTNFSVDGGKLPGYLSFQMAKESLSGENLEKLEQTNATSNAQDTPAVAQDSIRQKELAVVRKAQAGISSSELPDFANILLAMASEDEPETARAAAAEAVILLKPSDASNLTIRLATLRLIQDDDNVIRETVCSHLRRSLGDYQDTKLLMLYWQEAFSSESEETILRCFVQEPLSGLRASKTCVLTNAAAIQQQQQECQVQALFEKERQNLFIDDLEVLRLASMSFTRSFAMRNGEMESPRATKENKGGPFSDAQNMPQWYVDCLQSIVQV